MCSSLKRRDREREIAKPERERERELLEVRREVSMARAWRARSWEESSLTSGVRNGFSDVMAVDLVLLEMCSAHEQNF